MVGKSNHLREISQPTPSFPGQADALVMCNTAYQASWPVLKSGCNGPNTSTQRVLDAHEKAGKQWVHVACNSALGPLKSSEGQARSLGASDGTAWKVAMQLWPDWEIFAISCTRRLWITCNPLPPDDTVDFCLTLPLETYPNKQGDATKNKGSCYNGYDTKIYVFLDTTQMDIFTVTVQNQIVLTS